MLTCYVDFFAVDIKKHFELRRIKNNNLLGYDVTFPDTCCSLSRFAAFSQTDIL